MRRQLEEMQDRVREYELQRTNHLGRNAKEMMNQELVRNLEEAEAQIDRLKIA